MTVPLLDGPKPQPSLAACVFIFLIGLSFFGLSLTQPTWIDGRIGPGLFARWTAAAVVVLALIWATAIIAESLRDRAQLTLKIRGSRPEQGLALLGAVLIFIIINPLLGLVPACAATGIIASWGAGDRTRQALALSALCAGLLALALGLTLLPPTTGLWPWSPF